MHSLMTGWVGDRLSYDSTGSQGYENSLRLDSANNRIKGVPAGNSQQVYAFSQRIANDPQFQDRQVSITFENAGPAVARTAGIMLFGTPGSSDYTTALYSIAKCYLLQVAYTAAGAFNLNLYRSRGNQGVALLAQKTGISLTLGTPFTLRFVCDTQVVPSPRNGFVRLKAYIGGVQQTWDAAAGLYTDIEIQSTGTVIDRKSTRLSSGLGQGLQFSSATVATANVFFDSWAVGAGDTPYDTLPEDQATIAVAAENDAASGTFTVPYDWGSSEESEYLVNDHRFDTHHRYVGLVQSRTRTRYTIGNNAATSSEITTLKAFYTSHRGVQIPFSWTNPKGTSVTVRFTNDTLAIEQVTPSVYRWSCTLEEVLSE
jgi:phage-related protein